MRAHQPLEVVLAAWCLVLLLAGPVCSRTVHATIPYRIAGGETVLGADGTAGEWGVGSLILSYHAMRDMA